MKIKVILFTVLIVALFGIGFSVNAPVQDVYNFDLSTQIDAWVLNNVQDALAPAGLPNGPILGQPRKEMLDEIVKLLQSAIAFNIDPSVEILKGANGFRFDLNAIQPLGAAAQWNPQGNITDLALYIMAVKVMGREAQALEYAQKSPSFTDIRTALEGNQTAVVQATALNNAAIAALTPAAALLANAVRVADANLNSNPANAAFNLALLTAKANLATADPADAKLASAAIAAAKNLAAATAAFNAAVNISGTTLPYTLAYGYAEYYQRVLITEFPCLMDLFALRNPAPAAANNTYTLQNTNPAGSNINLSLQTTGTAPTLQTSTISVPHNQVPTRAQTLEFIVRLAQAKFPKYFGSIIVEPELQGVLGKNPSIVDFSKNLSSYLRDLYGQTLPSNVGFIYAFEFFFLTEVDASEVGKGEPNVRIAYPILYTDIFRLQQTVLGGVVTANSYDLFPNYGASRRLTSVVPGTLTERWWAIALFAKVFATDSKLVQGGLRAPARILNNVVAFNPVDTANGQVVFNDVSMFEGAATIGVPQTNQNVVLWDNTPIPATVPGVADGRVVVVPGPGTEPNVGYTFATIRIGETSFIITNQTILRSAPAGIQNGPAIPRFNQAGFDYLGLLQTAGTVSVVCNPTNQLVSYNLVGAGQVRTSQKTDLRNINIWNPSRQDPTGAIPGTGIPNIPNGAIPPNDHWEQIVLNMPTQLSEIFDAYDVYRIFLPNINDINKAVFGRDEQGTILRNLLNMILCSSTNDEFQKFVKREDRAPVANLVTGEWVIFDIVAELPAASQLQVARVLPARDRLNHIDRVLTVGAVREFVKLYQTVTDQISTPNQQVPNVAYYVALLNFATENKLDDSVALLAYIDPVVPETTPKFTYNNYRTIEEVLGEITHLQRSNMLDTNLGRNKIPEITFIQDALGRIPTPTTGSAETDEYLNPVSVTIAGVPPAGWGRNALITNPNAGSLDNANGAIPTTLPPAYGSWDAMFVPYVNNTFRFSDLTTVALVDKGKVTKVQRTNGYELLLKNVFGFNGPKIDQRVITVGINPARDPAAPVHVVLKAYDM